MGSIRKRNGKFQAQVRRTGSPPLSKTFLLRKHAESWVRSIETEIDAGLAGLATGTRLTLRDLLCRYANEITPMKKGSAQEFRRISRLINDPISSVIMPNLSSQDMAKFRDRRIKDGLRAAQIDLVLIRHCIKTARTEWGVNLKQNPVEAIKIPNGIRKRDRRLRSNEYDALRLSASRCINPYIWPIIQFAIETGMRRSEILNLRWSAIDLDKGIATLPDTKNGTQRSVPLTQKSVSILSNVEVVTDRVFPVTSAAVRQSWDRLVKRAGIENLRFHDLRHEAISRFFEMGLSVAEVAAISGHKDPRMLFRYTHLNAETISAKLKQLDH